jgi:protein-tyrosine phosphatase
LAEGLAKSLAKERGIDIEIDSAGTSGYHIGEPPCSRSIAVASKNGVDISNLQGRRVNPLDVERFDLFIVMDSMNYNDMVRAMNFPKDRVYKLGNFGFDGKDVPDPYHFPGNEGFDEVFRMIKKGVEEIFLEFRIGS